MPKQKTIEKIVAIKHDYLLLANSFESADGIDNVEIDNIMFKQISVNGDNVFHYKNDIAQSYIFHSLNNNYCLDYHMITISDIIYESYAKKFHQRLISGLDELIDGIISSYDKTQSFMQDVFNIVTEEKLRYKKVREKYPINSERRCTGIFRNVRNN